MIPLVAGLASVTHPMTSLLLAGVELQPKGANLLFRMLSTNSALSATLCEVDISNNLLSNIGSIALADWMLQLNEVSKLQGGVFCLW